MRTQPSTTVCGAKRRAVVVTRFDDEGRQLVGFSDRVDVPCGGCGQWLERRFGPPRPPRTARLVCSCGWRGKEAVTMQREPTGPVDPEFGLELWFTVPFEAEIVWAYNAEHLRFLRDYIASDLRERAPNRNGSLASRLPRWMKAAKHRDALVALIDELEATADG